MTTVTANQGLKLEIRTLGRLGYEEALALQFEMVEARRDERIPDTLLLLEHPPVITMGRKAEESDILAPESELTGTGVSIHRINRGGETTYHGPGQVVGYAIINLYNHQRQLRKFVDRMEQVFIDLLDAEYGIAAHSDADHRGVWVGSDKIAAIGIAVTRGITMHGFAFNVMPDLSHFDWIIPCGIRDRGVTSLEKLTGQPVAMDTTMRLVGSYFASTYGYEASWAD